MTIASIGEVFVPGALPEPAKPCSPTPSTRPDDPYLTYSQPGKQKKPTNESLPTTPSTPWRSSKNSSLERDEHPEDASRGCCNTAGGKAGRHHREAARRARAISCAHRAQLTVSPSTVNRPHRVFKL
jgi:hypothetical protein